MNAIDETHAADLACWVEGAGDHAEFPIQNLPLGIFSRGDTPRGGMAIGDFVLDLAALAAQLDGEARDAAAAASGPTLNPLLALGAAPRRALRRAVSALLSDPQHRARVEPCLHPAAECTLHLPAQIGDYTDFYVGINHATNIGSLFRPDNPLLPNYKHIPIGYHGRASSIRPTGAPLRRPLGQLKAPDADGPVRAATRRLDYEVEMGVWIGPGNALGDTIAIGEAAQHIAGLSLLNDWSARDIQAWEYQPLGPFLAKSFLSTISPWIVTAEALAPFRTAQRQRPEGDPRPLPYLLDEGDQQSGALAITLEATLSTARMREAGLPPHRLSRASATEMYWTIAQMVTHHASNGCDLRPGDLLGTGTISAADASGFGSLMELTRSGAEPLSLPSGEQRSFLEDGDQLTLTGRAETEGFRPIGFGACTGTVLPAAA